MDIQSWKGDKTQILRCGFVRRCKIKGIKGYKRVLSPLGFNVMVPKKSYLLCDVRQVNQFYVIQSLLYI